MQSATFFEALAHILPADCLKTAAEDMRPYECDGLSMYRALPKCVALPENEAQLAAVMKVCHAHRVPVVSRGAGTGLSGGAMPDPNALLLSTAKMMRILDVDALACTARVQPGVRNLAISEAVAPLGLFFGRIANFINGELWGRETTVPWAIRFCNARIEQMYGFCPAGNEPRHPSQLYEAGLEGLLLFVILSLAIWKWRMLKRPGFVTGLFLLGYGVCRAALENVRQPDAGFEHLPLGLTMGMILSIPMMLVGAWLIWRALKKPVVAEA